MLISENLALVASLQFGIGSGYDCHVYAVRQASGITLVDSGSGLAPDRLLAELDSHWPGAKLEAIILTHSHADHACGAQPLRARTGCAVYSPDVCLEAIRIGDEYYNGLAEARALGMYTAQTRLLPCPDAVGYSDGSAFQVGVREYRPIHVRGHSDDSHCLVTEVDGRRTLFAGDVIFFGAMLGVIDRHDSGMDGYREDLAKLAELDIDALLPGHGIFTVRDGQSHIDKALDLLGRGLPIRQIGQSPLIF